MREATLAARKIGTAILAGILVSSIEHDNRRLHAVSREMLFAVVGRVESVVRDQHDDRVFKFSARCQLNVKFIYRAVENADPG